MIKRRKIELNALPEWSSWPERLLGLSPWTPKPRTIAKTEQEYNKEKYFSCLERYKESNGEITMEHMKLFELGDPDAEVCVSFTDELFVMRFGDALEEYYRIIKQKLIPMIKDNSTVVELGTGYGYNLALLQTEISEGRGVAFLGGEYSQNAIQLASLLFNGEEYVSVEPFNFYETPYHLLEKTQGPIVLFTVFGVHQMPKAQAFIDGLRPFTDRIDKVVCFESIFELYDDSLLGLMRKRYIELCDYNTDLLTLLERSPDVEIISKEANLMGLNPLLPMSIVEWKFR